MAVGYSSTYKPSWWTGSIFNVRGMCFGILANMAGTVLGEFVTIRAHRKFLNSLDDPDGCIKSVSNIRHNTSHTPTGKSHSPTSRISNFNPPTPSSQIPVFTVLRWAYRQSLHPLIPQIPCHPNPPIPHHRVNVMTFAH